MGEESKPKEIRFVYEKARHHRTLHADGTWASLTPQVEIQFAFFNNLRRLPISETRAIQDDNTLAPGKQEEKGDIVREVDVTVVMNMKATKAVIGLLQEMVEKAEAIIAQQKADKPTAESHADKNSDVEKVQ